MRFIRYIIIGLLLSSCQSGSDSSGSSGGNESSSAQLSSWNNISYPSTVTATGVSYEGTYVYDTGTTNITSIGGASAASSPSIALTYNSSQTLTSAKVTTGSQTQTYDNFSSANANGTFFFAYKTNDSGDWAIAAEPTDDDNNWKYQSIAVWTEADNGSGKYGSISAGSTTSGSSIPTSGTNTAFSGRLSGFYSDSSNRVYAVQADVTLGANFVGKSISFASSNTIQQLYTGTFQNATTNDNLNLSGTLTYSDATNSISGTLTTNSGISGPSQTRFYGPNAEEIGGAFNVSGSSQHFVGAFGAKQ